MSPAFDSDTVKRNFECTEFQALRADIAKFRRDFVRAIYIQGAVIAIIYLACEFL